MSQHILIYDDNCPLCVAYTKAFVKWGLLKPEERQPFSTVKEEWLQQIDFEKAKNEIPYLNTATGEVLYGIDAMLEILNQKLPFVKPVGKFKPVNWLLRRLYKFISYNRKVIVAVKCGSGAIDCAPDFSYFYRWLFMLCFLTFNTLMLFPVHEHILKEIPGYELTATELQVYHAGLVGVNVAVALLMGKRKATEYLGQVNVLAIITMGCLGLYTLLLQWVPVSSVVHLLVLGTVLLLVASEYARRIHFLGFAAKDTRLISINLISLSVFLFLLFK